MRILVVEDEPFTRDALAAIMENYGVCTAAGEGRSALAAFSGALESGEPYDLITLDIEMPEMNGQEILTRIRETEKIKSIPADERAKVVMLTCHAEREHLSASIRAGCDDYILKPFSRKIVEEKLRKLNLL